MAPQIFVGEREAGFKPLLGQALTRLWCLKCFPATPVSIPYIHINISFVLDSCPEEGSEREASHAFSDELMAFSSLPSHTAYSSLADRERKIPRKPCHPEELSRLHKQCKHSCALQ